jgi:hypothetical protein
MRKCDTIYDDFWKVEEERISKLSQEDKEHEECRKRYHVDVHREAIISRRNTWICQNAPGCFWTLLF